ncbi:MAG: AEC family transporter, partial [Lachnospiraceae bacterium]|nr:AEC family transporter [Lachnospiraceae bacterium]
MQDILTRAGCFIAIIILGYGLRRLGFFQEGDFKVLSKIALKITLPAAIITSFSGKEIDPSMLIIAVLGLGAGLIYVSLGYLLNMRAGKDQQAFGMVNMSGYNIGNFTMPFVQSFLGPVGVITTSLFDVGNACVCLGGSYSLASIIKGS